MPSYDRTLYNREVYDKYDYETANEFRGKKTYEALGLETMFNILYEGCKTGKLLRLPYDGYDGVLPAIEDAFFNILKASHRNKFIEEKIKAAIEKGACKTIDQILGRIARKAWRISCEKLHD